MNVETPDAIHLATAITYEADEFHTLDGAGKKKRSTDLLKLGTKIAGRYNLLICKPEGPQAGLLTNVPTIKIEGSMDKAIKLIGESSVSSDVDKNASVSVPSQAIAVRDIPSEESEKSESD